MKFMKDLVLAIRFLTIFPVYKFSDITDINTDNENLARNFSDAMIYFPFVGLLIGAFLVLFNEIVNQFFQYPLLNNALLLFLWSSLSGGLHLDGFADMVDGFSGGNDKASILKIMKDSSIGAKGVIALIFLLLFKFSLLVEINDIIKNSILLLAPALGRWSMIAGAFYSQPASDENSLGGKFMKYLGKKELILSTIIILIPGILLFRYVFFILFGLSVTVIWVFLKYCHKKIGGITGDNLGALNEIIEPFCLLVFCFLEILK